MAGRTCVVSFKDSEGIAHSVSVHAETLYEAAVLALSAFREHGCAPGSGSVLEIEVKSPSVTHSVAVKKIHDWVNGACKSPNEKVTKERLKKMLV